MRILFSLLTVLPLVASMTVPAADIALTHVNLVDVEKLQIRPEQTVLIKDGLIVAIVPADKPIPSGYAAVDLSGKYLLPGLIDAHVHHATVPEGSDNPDITRQRLQRLLHGGVTTVRDMGGDVRVLSGLKRSAQLDLIPAPDIYYSVILGGRLFFNDPRTVASALGEKPGDTDWMRAVDNNTDFAALMQRTVGTGASGIKIYASVPSVIVGKLAEAAKEAGLKVWSHAFIGPDTPQTVVDAGVEVISHVPDLSAQVIDNYVAWRRRNATISETEQQASFQPERYSQLLQSMQQQGTILDATLTVFEKYRHTGTNREVMFQHGVFLTRLAHQHGIRISAGTDSVDDNSVLPLLHHELKLLVEQGGLTPAEAVQAATLNSALAIGIADSTGSVSVGKKANLLVLNDDPFADIRNSRSIAYVLKNGRFIDRGDDLPTP